MVDDQWYALGEVTAGSVWAAVAEHPGADSLDRTHCNDRTSVGFLLSPDRNLSRGCFLTKASASSHAPLGTVVAIPKGIPFSVRSRGLPPRRMLHCRLPDRASASQHPLVLRAYLDLRNDALIRSLKRLADEVTEPGFAANLIVEGLGLVIAGELDRAVSDASRTHHQGGLAPWQVRRIDEYIRGGNWNCSVSDIAALCGISPGHAMRAFRQSTGRSIAAHLVALRIDHACTLLRQNRLLISEVAAELRFASPSAFSTAFRRVIGNTPRGFRQRHCSSGR